MLPFFGGHLKESCVIADYCYSDKMSKPNIKFRYNDSKIVEVKQTQPGPLLLNNLHDSYLAPQYMPINIQQRTSPVKSSSLEKAPPAQQNRAGSQTLLLKSRSSHVLIAEEPSSQQELNERPVIQEVTSEDLIRHNNKKREETVKPQPFAELISKKDISKREQPPQQSPKKEQPQQKGETPFPVKPVGNNQSEPKKQQRPIEINPLIMPVGTQKNEPTKKMTKQQIKAAYQYNGIPVREDESKGGCCSWCGNCNCKKTQKAYPIRQ